MDTPSTSCPQMMRYLLLAVGLVLAVPAVRAQSTIQANVTGIPPVLPNPFVADFIQGIDDGRFLLQVTVTGGEPVTTTWKVTIRRDGQDLFSAVSEPVVYEPGLYTYRTLNESPAIRFGLSVSDIQDRLPRAVRDVVLQTGAFPEGLYTVEFEPTPSGDALGITGEADFEVLFPDPPELVAPYGGEIVEQSPLFTWTPVVTSLGITGIRYRLQMVEILPSQTPAVAIAANRPILDVFVDGLTTFAYTPDLYPLEPGRHYAWFVVAETEELPIRAGGASEVATFVYEPVGGFSVPEPPVDVPPPPGTDTRSDSTSILIPLELEVPEVLVMGRVEWRVPSGGSGPLAEAIVQVVGTVDGQRQVLVTASTDGSGAFSVIMPNPALAGSALFGSQPQDVRVEASFPGGAGTLFTFGTVALAAVPAGTPSVDLGTIPATVSTFRVSASATDRRTGARIEGLTVTPLRTEGHVRTYGFLGYDGGERLQPDAPRVATPDGLLTLVATASPAAGRTGAVIAAPTEMAPVWALVQAPGYYDRVVDVSPEGGDVQLTTSLDPRGAVLTGRVLHVGDREPLTEARLTVQSGAARYEARPDAEGRFAFEGMTANGQEGRFRVYYQGRVMHEELLVLTPTAVYERDPLLITTEPIAVIGTVNDTDGNPVPNATVSVSGGAVQSEVADAGGQYVFALVPGTYTITGEKTGYEVERLSVVVNADGSTVQTPAGRGPGAPPEPTIRWVRPYSEFASAGLAPAALDDAEERLARFGTANPLVLVNPDITLDRQTAAVVFNVWTGGFNNRTQLPGASVFRYWEGSSIRAGSDGRTAPARLVVGTYSVALESHTAPNGATFAPRTVTFEVTAADALNASPKIVDLYTVGVPALTGVVTGGGRPISGAVVYIEGLSGYVSTTGPDGRFRIAAPNAGSFTMQASATGWNSGRTTASGRDVAIALQPLPAGNPTINTLLGFPVRVTSTTQQSGGYRISGEVTAVRGNALTKAGQGVSLTFSNVDVQMQDGVAVPQGGRVLLRQTEMPVEVFGLKAVLHAPQGLALVGEGGRNGAIVGTLSLDLAASYPQKAGWAWTQGRVPLEVPGLPTTGGGVALFPADGQLANVSALRFASETPLTIQGFPFRAGRESAITASGLRLNGRITLTSLDGSPTVSAPQVDITREGRIGGSRLAFDPPQQITNDKWTLRLASGRLADGAVLVDGTARMAQRGADPFDASFTGLSITPKDLFAGSFRLPTTGIRLIDALRLTTPAANPFSLGSEGAGTGRTLFLTGNGEIGFDKYIRTRLPVSEFKFSSDGAIGLKANVGFKTAFAGVLDYELKKLEFGNVGPGQALGLRLDGSLTLMGLNNDKTKLGPIVFLESGGIFVEQFELEYQLTNVGKVSVGFAFLADQNNIPEICGPVADGEGPATGFCGKGGFELEKFNKGLEVNVHFFSRGGGTTFGAGLVGSIPDIAIGTTGLVLSKPGGGFSYNTGPKTFNVYMRGDITVGPSNVGTGMQPLMLGIRSGPVIEGSAKLTMATSEFGEVKVVLDVNKQFFSVLGKVGKSFMPGVELSGDIGLVVGAENRSGYFFLGSRVTANLAGFFNANVALATGYNYPIASHSDFVAFTNHIPGDYRPGNRVNGIHIDARALVGNRQERCEGFLGINLCSYAYNDTFARLNKSFTTTRFDMLVGSDWGIGGRASVLSFNAASLNASLSGQLGGSYSDARGWAVAGRVRGSLNAKGGYCPTRCDGLCKPIREEKRDCSWYDAWCWANQIVRTVLPPTGFDICPAATVDFNYVQRPFIKTFNFDW